MKINVSIEVDIDFDMTREEQSQINPKSVEEDTVAALEQWIEDSDVDEYITDGTGWCISGLSLRVKAKS